MPNGLTQELLEVVDHGVAAVEVYVPEDDLIVKFTFADVLAQEGPPVQSHPHIPSGLNQIHLVGVRLELQEHGHVIEVGVGVAARDVADCLIAPE